MANNELKEGNDKFISCSNINTHNWMWQNDWAITLILVKFKALRKK